MTFSRLVFSFLLVVVVAAGFASRSARTAAAESAAPLDSRTFDVVYQVHFPATPGVAGPAHLWIPAPTRTDAYQTPASSVSITGTVQHAIGHDPEYGDEFIVFNPTPEQVASGFDAGIRFTTTRQEYVALRNGVVVRKASEATPSAALLPRYLPPDK